MKHIYYYQFYSHLTYGCQLWGQKENEIDQTITLQKKAIRLITFSHYQAHSSPLFKELGLLKLTDIIKEKTYYLLIIQLTITVLQPLKISLHSIRQNMNIIQ